jgi:hypothetical protein
MAVQTQQPVIKWDNLLIAIGAIAVADRLWAPLPQLLRIALILMLGLMASPKLRACIRPRSARPAINWVYLLLAFGWAGCADHLLELAPRFVRIALILAIAWIGWPKLRAWIRPVAARNQTPPSSPPPPAAPRPIQARMCIMGPEHAVLADRVDPLTRTRFEEGERFVLCGGRCGRAYKLVTCEQLRYRCPEDGALLRVSIPST